MSEPSPQRESASNSSDDDASQQRLRLMADNAPLLVGYIDIDGRYRFNNQTDRKSVV